MREAVVMRNYVEASQAKGNCSLCAQDVENLKMLPLDNTIFMSLDKLSDEGYQEMFGLGSRLKTVFPNLISNLTESEYTFRSTFDDKLADSAKAFLDGIGNKALKIEKVTHDDAMAVSIIY